MSLSKVYRAAEAGDLKEFQFRSFGDTEPLPPTDGDSFSVPSLAEPMAPAASVAVTAPDLSLAQQVEEAYARGRQEGLAMAEQRVRQ